DQRASQIRDEFLAATRRRGGLKTCRANSIFRLFPWRALRLCEIISHLRRAAAPPRRRESIFVWAENLGASSLFRLFPWRALRRCENTSHVRRAAAPPREYLRLG